MIDFEIGTYGCEWIEFMERNHKSMVRKMKANGTFIDVAKSVDNRAWEYRFLLDRQYAELHPRPTGFENTVAWETTRAFYTDGTVMREVVLVAVTEP